MDSCYLDVQFGKDNTTPVHAEHVVPITSGETPCSESSRNLNHCLGIKKSSTCSTCRA